MGDADHPHVAAAAPGTLMRMYRGLMGITAFIAAMMFTGMAVLVCLDVLLRNTGITSITWSVEVTEYMLMISAFLAAPWLVFVNDHIRVDILVRGLTGRPKWWCDLIQNVVCLLICVVLAGQSIYSMLDSAQQGGMVFKVLIFPDWWMAVPMVICFVLLTIEFIRRLVLDFTHTQKVA